MFEPQKCHFLSLSVWQVKKLPVKLKQISSRLFLPDSWSHCWPPCKLLQFYSFSQSAVKFPTIQPSTCKLSKMQTCVLAPVCQLLYCCCFSVATPCPTPCNPMPVARQASLSFSISQSLLKLMSIESVMPSNHLNFCRPFLLLLSLNPSLHQGLFQWVFFAKGGQSIGVSVLASVFPMNIQHSKYYTLRLKCLFFMFFMYYLCESIICIKRKC